ncbi:hypothetical protein [Demequina aurantiaca]|uniref:hypothetical protein n=1 Tax=Demequina aurantiaca TaxID=676200 RepID=UPI003D34AF72
MLNSKYAPIVALTVLAILVIAALGWFLAISPQFAKADALNADTDAVNSNITMVQTSSAKLDDYQAQADAAASNEESIALNTPTTYDLQAFRERASEAIEKSNVEIIGLTQETAFSLEGWTATPAQLTSTAVAKLFAVGPITVAGDPNSTVVLTEDAPAAATDTATDDSATPTGDGAWAAIVTPKAEDGPVALGLVMIPLTLSVTGTAAELNTFFELMANPDDPIFQVYEVTANARPAGSSTQVGVSEAEDGDVIATVTGAMYLLNADTTVIDEEALVVVKPAEDSAFTPVGDAPAQSGE